MYYQKRCVSVALLVGMLLLPHSISAQVTFGLRQTQGTTWWSGYTVLKSLIRRISVHEYFIDVEEDIEFETAGSPPPNNPNTLEITGQFRLPKQSVLTGVLIWDGGNILKGKLKSKTEARSQYEEVVDRNTSPPPRPRDPIIVEKVGDDIFAWDHVCQKRTGLDRYNFNIYPIAWGQSRKIRIRYLCPFTYIQNHLVLPVPYSFDYIPWNTRTGQFEATLQLSGNENISSVQIDATDSLGNDTIIQCQLPYTLQQRSGEVELNYEKNIGYQQSLRFITIDRCNEALLATTSFPDGDWQGNYAMFWGTPPDSLIMNAGFRREIVVLWKWNFWNTFVYVSDTGKTISPYGAEAIAQAKKIMELNRNVTVNGDRVGLLLEKGSPAQNKLFPLCKKNSDTFDTLQQFLEGIDSAYLFLTISGTAPPIDIRIAESERENFFRQGAQSFDISLKLVCSLFSEHEKVIKHIVLLSAGPVPEMPNLEDFYQNNDVELSDKITISAYGSSPRYPTGYWPGVPLYKIVEKHAYTDNGTTVNGIWLPEEKERLISMTIRSESASYERNLFYSGKEWVLNANNIWVERSDTFSVDTVTFAGHSLTPWNKQVEWKAYDGNHSLLASYINTPLTIDIPQDTFLVKLFAGAESPVSDTIFTSGRGARYGVVDEQYSLLALEEDAVAQKEKVVLADAGVPFLSDDEIFIADATEESAVVRQNLNKTLNKPAIALINGIIRIQLPSSMRNVTVRIYNLAGKLVFDIPLKNFNSSNQIAVNLRRVLSRGVYTISISSMNMKFNEKISLL